MYSTVLVTLNELHPMVCTLGRAAGGTALNDIHFLFPFPLLLLPRVLSLRHLFINVDVRIGGDRGATAGQVFDVTPILILVRLTRICKLR